MKIRQVNSRILIIFITILLASLTSGCPEKKLEAFDSDGILDANIRRTEFGVPHIQADNLESLGFGVGYAFAQDNACILADIIMRYNSERSRYLGPDQIEGSGDALHLISDFGFLALEVREKAEANINLISARQHAMISGYTHGYNRYLADTGITNIDPTCAGKPWVRPITEVDLLTALISITLLPGSSQFLAPMFVAAPPGIDFRPTPAPAAIVGGKIPAALHLALNKINMPRKNPLELGSNGWALGSEKTKSGNGMLLANPHFPHTGELRFWQFHSTIPGVLDVMGSSLAGTPGMVNIGFNRHLAWTHTFSSAEHFIVYQLALNNNDNTGLTYTVDENTRTITRKTKTLPVAVAPGVVIPFQKNFYYSQFGPMITIPDQLTWGQDPTGSFTAFSIKDANKLNLDVVDHWLAMNLARSMDEFKAAFQRYDGVIFNNTIAVDANGHTFYIDDSNVPHLSPAAEQLLRTSPQLQQIREQAGFTILPGSTSLFDFSETVPYESAPKLERNDFVQNANDSFWLSNPLQPITDISILYGKQDSQQSLRSRMGQKMLQDSAGDDGLFTMNELESVLFNFRSFLGESILEDLIAQCQTQGDIPVQLENFSINIADGCSALSQWDGRFYKSSRAAHLFREFATEFNKSPQWQFAFDPAQPLTTPNTLRANDITLQQFAQAIVNVQSAGVTLDAMLGEVQFVQRTDENGNPATERLPWSGSHNIEGGFNVFRPAYGSDNSLLPRTHYTPVPGSQISADAGGYSVDYGSSWMMLVEFTNKGPKARGLMTYSQSINPLSEHQLDQSRAYSGQPQLFELPFTKKEIAEHTQSELHLRLNK